MVACALGGLAHRGRCRDRARDAAGLPDWQEWGGDWCVAWRADQGPPAGTPQGLALHAARLASPSGPVSPLRPTRHGSLSQLLSPPGAAGGAEAQRPVVSAPSFLTLVYLLTVLIPCLKSVFLTINGPKDIPVS